MGLLQSSWLLILGLFLHLTHLSASMLPPIVAVTVVVQSQAGCWLSFSAICTNASLPLPPTWLVSSLSSSRNPMNPVLVCSEEHPSAHYVIIVCVALSLFSQSLLIICGEGHFFSMGHWEDLREMQSPLLSRDNWFYCAEKYLCFSLSEWDWSNAVGLGSVWAGVPSPHLERSATLRLVCHCSLPVDTWQLQR